MPKGWKTKGIEALRLVAKGLGLSLLFVLFAAFALVIHLDLPAQRRAIREIVQDVLNEALEGHASLGPIESVGFFGIEASQIEFTDPEGRVVVAVEKLTIGVDLVDIAVRGLRFYEKWSIAINRVNARDVRVNLLPTTKRAPNGELLAYASIQDAFTPRPSNKSNESDGRPIRIWLENIDLERVLVREQLTGLPVLDITIPITRASLLVAEGGIALDVREFDLTAKGAFGADARAHGKVAVRAPGATSGEVRGTIGGVPFEETFRIDGDKWALEGHSENIRAEAAKALYKEWPFDQPVTLTHELTGTYPRFRVDAALLADVGKVTAKGRLGIVPEFETDVDIDAENIDPARLNKSWPRANITLRSTTEFWLRGGRPRATFNATLFPSQAFDTEFPAMDFRGTLRDEGLSLNGIAHERGLPLHLEASKKPEGDPEFELVLGKTILEESPRIRKFATISGRTQARVKGKLSPDRLHLDVSIDGNNLAYSGAKVETLGVRGTIEVPLADPHEAEAALVLDTKELVRGPVHLKTAKLTTRGKATAPRLGLEAVTGRDENVKLETTASLDPPRLDAFRATVTGTGKPILVSFDELSRQDARTRLSGFVLESEGRLEAFFDFGERSGHAKVNAKNLNIGRIADRLGGKEGSFKGRLDADIDVLVGDQSRGKIDVALREGDIAEFGPASAHAIAVLDGRRVDLKIDGKILAESAYAVDASVTLGGHPYDAPSYEKATYLAQASVTGIDLADLKARYLPEDKTLVSGLAATKLKFEKKDPALIPDLGVEVTTQDLSLTYGEGEERRTIRGADIAAYLDTSTTKNEATLSARLFPTTYGTKLRRATTQTDFVTVSATFDLPLSEVDRSYLALEKSLPIVRKAPVSASFAIPERSLGSIDEVVRLPTVTGSVEARGAVRGTLDDPEVFLTAQTHGIVLPPPYDKVPLSIGVKLDSVPMRREISGEVSLARDSGTKSVAIGTLRTNLVVAPDAFDPKAPDSAPRWTGVVQVNLDEAPLSLVPLLAERGIEGKLQGGFAINRADFLPIVSGKVRLRELAFDGTSLGDGEVELKNEGEIVALAAKLRDDYGELDLSLESRAVATPWALALDDKATTRATIEALDWNVAPLHPFLQESLREFSGTLSGKAKIELPPNAEVSKKPRLEGNLALTDGTVTLKQMGLPLEAVEIQAALTHEGAYNVIRVPNAVAKAHSNRQNVRGNLALYLDGFELHHGEFKAELDEVPVLREGVKLAILSGKTSGKLESNPDELKVSVTIPELAVDMPLQSTDQLISLEEDPSISLSRRIAPSDPFEKGRDGGRRMAIDVQLGNKVRVTNQLMDIRLVGSPKIIIEDEVSLSGNVELVRGSRVQVLSRAFIVDQGTVVLDEEDLANPFLDITATWRAPSGVLAIAKLTGKAKEPTLTWSSDPPLPGGENAVAALVLGGSAGNSSGDAGSAGLTYGAAALNQLLGQTGVRGVEFYASRESSSSNRKVAQFTNSAWDNYTAAFRISDELWFEGSYQKEASGPGTKPRSGFSGSLDWRFRPDWSARTDVGSLGVGADVLWQYRY